MEEYIVSARKYRPTSFDSVVGQPALTTTLKNAVKSGKLAHAYLFCGPRGVGKTTCARIFAKAINCQSPTADGEACNQCESCMAFNEQRSFNIFELDAASNNSVEHIKTLMEQTRIPPQVGRYKVFIIDEVHMLSTAAFNAFLKTLEEPPSHVIFILATTEKHKILPTILSRCQIYDFERMTVKGTIDHLRYVAEKEGIAYEEEALAVIAEKADGGMRDALSIFDQAASFCQGNITYQKVIEDLNVLDSEYYFRIIDLSLQNNVREIMVLVNSIINKGFDGGLLIGGLAKHVRNVLMAKDESTLPLLETSDQQRAKFSDQAKRCDARFLYQALRLMNQCDINYRQSSNKRLLVELTLIEVAQITQPDEVGASAGRRPRRLKTLFKNLVQQAQPAIRASQVAPVAPKKEEAEQSNEKTNKVSAADGVKSTAVETPTIVVETSSNAVEPSKPKAEPTTTYNSGARPVLKAGSGIIGSSWSAIRDNAKPKPLNIPGITDVGKKEDESTTEAKPADKQFTQDDLEFQWAAMCNRMALLTDFSAIAARMKNMKVAISELPNIVVTVDNQIILDEMQSFKPRIIATMKKSLGNDAITINLHLAEIQPQERILSRREQFEKFSAENPAIAKLQKLLELELA